MQALRSMLLAIAGPAYGFTSRQAAAAWIAMERPGYDTRRPEYIYIYIHSQVGLVVCVGVFSPIGPMGLEYGMFCLGDTSATYSLKLHVQIPAGEALQHSTTNNIE